MTGDEKQKLQQENGELRERVRQLERQLARHEERSDLYRSVFETTGTATCIINPDATIHTANSQFCQLAGLELEQVEGANWSRFVHPEDVPWMTDRYRRRIEGDTTLPSSYGFRFVDSENSIHHVHMTISAIPSTRQIIVSLMDVTRQHQDQKALTASEARYRSLAEAAQDLIITMDLRGNITYANLAAREVAGLEMEQLLGKSIFNWVYRDDHEKIRKQVMQRIRGNQDRFIYEALSLDVNGQLIPMEVSSVTIPTPKGRTEILIIARDITERRRMTESLHEREELLRSILESAPVYIALLDGDKRYRMVNHRYAQIFGLNPEDFIGKQVEDVLPGDVLEQTLDHADKALSGEQVTYSVIFAPPWDSEKHHFHGIYNPLRNEQGEVEGYVVTVVDITEQRKAERAMRESETLRVAQRLAGAVAHEFRQPLAALKLTADLASSGRLEKAPQEQNLSRIPELVDRINTLVTKLLSITQVESKPYTDKMDILDLERSGGVQKTGK